MASDLKLGSGSNGSAGNALQTGGVLNVTGIDSTSGNGNRALVIGEFPQETSTYALSAGSLNVPNGATVVAGNGMGVFNISGGTANLNGLLFDQFNNSSGGTLSLSGTGLLVVGSGGISQVYNQPAVINLSGGTLAASAGWSSSVAMNLAGTTLINPQRGLHRAFRRAFRRQPEPGRKRVACAERQQQLQRRNYNRRRHTVGSLRCQPGGRAFAGHR